MSKLWLAIILILPACDIKTDAQIKHESPKARVECIRTTELHPVWRLCKAKIGWSASCFAEVDRGAFKINCMDYDKEKSSEESSDD